MNSFILHETPLAGLMTIKRVQHTDSRGYLARIFCSEELSASGWHKPIAQINHTSTTQLGTLRGMHFQFPPHSEMKLVSCLKGKVWDVAVDIRAGSPTFLKWFGIELSAENCLALLIPEGFAHGFQTLTNNAELLYCHSAAYCSEAEDGLHPLDPELKISWPATVTEISEKDVKRQMINQYFKGVSL